MDKENLRIPIAIVIAGFFVAIAVILVGMMSSKQSNTSAVKFQSNLPSIRPISDKDHIKGSLSADIIMLEYSDLECAVCKKFHETMNKTIDSYGKLGKVAWVFRHLPISELHSKARTEAEAAECAGMIAGPDKFWDVINRIYAITPGDNGLDLNLLPSIVLTSGVTEDALSKCMAGNEVKKIVENDYQDGLIATENLPGTPHNIWLLKNRLSSNAEKKLTSIFLSFNYPPQITNDKKAIIISGGLPNDLVKLFIEAILLK